MRAQDLRSWVIRAQSRISSRALSPTTRRLLLIFATVGFATGVVLSLRAQPELLSDLYWVPIGLLVCLAVPVTLFLNSLEFVIMSRLIDREFSLRQAAEVTVIGSVANMLPVPGSTMVRLVAVKRAGASYKSGGAALMFVAAIWIGISFAYAGVWLWFLGAGLVFAWLMILAGSATAIVSVWVALVLFERPSQTIQLIAVKTGLVLTDAIRIYLCLLAVGASATFGQASVLTASSVLGSAVSVVPAGLGVREGFAALIGPLVGLSAASAFLSTSINRIFGFAVTLPLSLALGARRGS